MENIKSEIVNFNKDRDWDQFHSPVNLAKSICIESGELLECFQWNDNFDSEEVKYELADVMTYCLLLCDKLNLNPEEIIREKLEISAKKYPIDKAKGNSKKYTEL